MFVRPILVIVLFVCLAACASKGWKAEPGQFPSFEEAYRTLVRKELLGPRWATMPPKVQDSLVDCMAHYMKATVGTDDLLKLDAVFRGETTISTEEGNQILAKIDARRWHSWSNAELDERAQELGWGSVMDIAERYEKQGMLASVAVKKAQDDVINMPQFIRNATRDDMAYLEPYCPDIVPELKRF